MQLRHGLSEDEYKDVAAKVEMRVTEAVVAAYARSGGAAHLRQQVLTVSPSVCVLADPPDEQGGWETTVTYI